LLSSPNERTPSAISFIMTHAFHPNQEPISPPKAHIVAAVSIPPATEYRSKTGGKPAYIWWPRSRHLDRFFDTGGFDLYLDRKLFLWLRRERNFQVRYTNLTSCCPIRVIFFYPIIFPLAAQWVWHVLLLDRNPPSGRKIAPWTPGAHQGHFHHARPGSRCRAVPGPFGRLQPRSQVLKQPEMGLF
jgi:hypothetical protein